MVTTDFSVLKTLLHKGNNSVKKKTPKTQNHVAPIIVRKTIVCDRIRLIFSFICRPKLKSIFKSGCTPVTCGILYAETTPATAHITNKNTLA